VETFSTQKRRANKGGNNYLFIVFNSSAFSTLPELVFQISLSLSVQKGTLAKEGRSPVTLIFDLGS